MTGTKLTLENDYGTYSVGINKQDLTIGSMFEDLVIPVLLAAGYQQESIDNCLGEERL